MTNRMKGLLNTEEAASLLFFNDEAKEEDNSNDSNFNEATVTRNRKRTVVKRFRPEWLQEPLFAGWLKAMPNNPERCVCTVCNVILLAGHSELEKHAAGKKHSNALTANKKAAEEEVERLEDDTIANEVFFVNNETNERQTILRYLTPKEKINKRAIVRKATIKRKAEPPPQIVGNNLPVNPDAKFIRLLKSDTEDDFDDEESLDLDEHLPTPRQLLRQLKNDLKFTGNDFSDQDKQKNGNIDDDVIRAKVLEARLGLIEEKRRHSLNIYKLKLMEMETRIKLAEAEAVRSEELHQLRIAHIQLQIQKENQIIVDSSEMQPEPPYEIQ